MICARRHVSAARARDSRLRANARLFADCVMLFQRRSALLAAALGRRLQLALRVLDVLFTATCAQAVGPRVSHDTPTQRRDAKRGFLRRTVRADRKSRTSTTAKMNGRLTAPPPGMPTAGIMALRLR